MKKNVLKHSLIITAMLGIFILSLGKMASARKLPPPPPPLRFTQINLCCEDGHVVNHANFCLEGEGNCTRVACVQGEIEVEGTMCP